VSKKSTNNVVNRNRLFKYQQVIRALAFTASNIRTASGNVRNVEFKYEKFQKDRGVAILSPEVAVIIHLGVCHAV